MEVRDLDYLLVVAERGSVLRAAEHLGMTQPAVTKAVARLERELGMPLFERDPRGMVPTLAGAALIARAKKIRLEYDDAMRELGELRAGTVGLLRFGFSPTIPAELVFGACSQLLRERPAARFQLRERLGDELMEALVGGEVDLVVARLPENAAENLSIVPLYMDQLFVVADSRHPLARRSGISLHDLTLEEWVLPPKGILLRQQLEEAFRKQDLPPPRLRVETDSNRSAMLGLLRGSRWLSLCRKSTLSQMGHLRALDLADGALDLRRSIGVLYRSGAYLAPVACRLVEILKERSGDQ
ncbi:LysR family transcriptional regulator [Cupriavidus pinatubonensis]|uniref:HTH-type transcriptional regulator GltC n=1 Tax=Cupriavidus pinatubonensis TaxID=248026 RepID=A0ABN7ZPU7_9BURK|nr:LysR family transcriptional regulator [Cupriavidus pinatubonensis]CAG9186696.1 HTH-type transcriptional regulator GltC [Cupriavidus pinatubonensis]